MLYDSVGKKLMKPAWMEPAILWSSGKIGNFVT